MLRDDVRRRSAARVAQHPLSISGYGEAARATGIVFQDEPGNLNGVFRRHELQQIKQDAVRAVMESTIAPAVARNVRCDLVANRQPPSAPHFTRTFIADVD